MYFLIYASSAVKPLAQSELLALLEKSRANNSRLGVTGMLLYKDGNFIQLLEGEEATVHDLYDKIAADERHRGLITFLQGAEPTRQFPDWSMAFRNLDAETEIDVSGYNEFLNTKFTGEEFSADPTRAQKLLLSFKKSL